MVRIGTQLYPLREMDGSFHDVLEAVADAGFEGVEFAYRVTDENPEHVRESLDETGLMAAGAHVPIDALEDDFGETVEFYETLGCEDLVVPHLDAEHFESVDNVERVGERLDAIAADLADRDLALHYHNHDHEFVDLDGESGLDALAGATDVGLELDLGLALAGGADPSRLLDRYADRVSLVHLKDVDTASGESVPLGEGDLDLDGCAETFAGNGGEWLFYEFEGADPLSTYPDAAERMADLR